MKHNEHTSIIIIDGQGGKLGRQLIESIKAVFRSWNNPRAIYYRRMNEMVINDCAAISGLSRVGISLWHKNVIALPDRTFVGGRFLNFVDVVPLDSIGDKSGKGM